jgi:hypothetical protein
MYKNDKFKIIKKPFVFTKNLKDNYKIIPFNKITTVLGPTKYSPPMTQE